MTATSSIRIATDQDRDHVATVLGLGFSDDPLMSWVFDGPDRVAKLTTLFGFIVREVVLGFGATYMVGRSVACWTPPEPPDWPETTTAAFLAMLPSIAGPEEQLRLAAMNEVMEANHPTEPHWYLGMIATEPDHRGGGDGGRLMAEALLAVDAAGLPAYLESSNPRNVSLYLRHGFEVTGELPIPGGPSMTAMWRPAR